MKENILDAARAVIQKRRYTAESATNRDETRLNSFDDYTANEKALLVQSIELARAKRVGAAKKEQAAYDKLLEKRRALLKKYGFPESGPAPNYFCKKCGDTGYVGGKRCSCLKAEITLLLFGESQIPYKSASFDTGKNSPDAKAHLFAREFCDKFPDVKRRSVILSGIVGTGKTYLASAIGNALIKKQIPVLYKSAFELNERFAELCFLKSDENSLYQDVLSNVDVLIIDDLGTEVLRPKVTVPYLQFLLEKRVHSGKTTIITTNYDLGGIQKIYGERIMSRLSDNTKFFKVELSGSDLRLAKPDKSK